MAKLIFMGSPQIAVPSLQALQEAGHEIPLVVTQPDKPKGRGQKISSPPIKLAAKELGRAVEQPTNLKTLDLSLVLKSLAPDFIVVVAYGKILPKAILDIAPCINVHFSLLPKYRGAACVAYALLNGEEETGVTTMLLNEKMDEGPILMQWTEAIQTDDTAGSLSERLATLGAQAIVKTLEGLESHNLKPVPQDPAQASYASLLKKEMGQVDWNQNVEKLYRLYQGLTPWPGIYTFLKGRRLILTEVRPHGEGGSGPVGKVEVGPRGEMFVQCGEGRLQILKLKPEGKRVLTAEEFMRGFQGSQELRLT